MISSLYLSSRLNLSRSFIIESLQQIEDRWGLDIPEITEDRIKFLKREFTFLDFFLSLQSFTDLSYMLDVIHKVQALLQHAAVDLREISEMEDVERVTDQLQAKIGMTKLEIRSVYLFPKVSKDGISVVTSNFVTDLIDTVVLNLGDLLKVYCSSSLLFVPGPKKDISDVFKELKLLRNFVCFVSESKHTDFFTHILEVVSYAAMIAWLYLPGSGSGENQEMNYLLSDLLQKKIKPVDPSIRKIYIDVLLALRSEWHPIIQIEHVAGFVETLQHNLKELPVSNRNTHQIAALQEMLNLLIANLSIQDLEVHLQDIDSVMIDSGLVVYSLCEDVVLGEVTIDLPGTIQRINTVIYHIIRKEFQSNLPRIPGIGYVDFVLSNLKEFQDRYPDSLAFVETQLQIIQTELKSVQRFLRFVAVEQYNNHNLIQNSVALLIAKAYEVEYIVDACVSKKVPEWCLELWLLDIIKDIRAEVADIQPKEMVEVDVVSPYTIATYTSHKSSELSKTSGFNEKIVGFEEEIETLTRRLIGGSRKLDIISIVGMPGAGKTTLAKRLYFDEFVVSHFDIRAQCHVSRVYSLRGLLLSLLTMLHIDETSLLSKEIEELKVTLYRILRFKTYLILLDDVWDCRVWDEVKLCLPDDNNGSRIFLTTRFRDVAYYVKAVSDPLHLRMLTYEESWVLLKIKVFGNETCSPLLENVGQEIGRKCEGLPLSIVLVAGVLSKMEKTEECWSQVAKDLGSYLASDAKVIIEPSYQHLPYHLKPCILYFGTFLEHKEINVSKLTWLWIGEGFVKDLKGRSLQNIAKGYLEDLISRNLVMDAKRSSDGKVKSCRIHGLLLDFCKRKAEQEHFLLWIKRDGNDKSSSGICSHKQLAQRRLVFYCEEVNRVEWNSCCSPVDSVLYREDKRIDVSGREVSQMFYNFKFVKVLALESIVIYSFPTVLVYLRYFAAQTAQDSITPLIANLWNLETLILKPTTGKLKLPVTIWKMDKLRDLCINNTYFTLNGVEGLFEKLEVLSSPCFSCAKDVELLSKKTPNLQELRCSFVDFEHDFFPKLDFLTRLETLEIHLAADSTVGGPYNFPASLRNLTLSNFFLGNCHESNISKLPNLDVLKLVSVFFDNDEWEVRDHEFQKLKVLKLVKCEFFEEWKSSDDAFSMLEHLVLCECPYLTEIPSSFEDIFTLKSIKVKSCSESVERSATDIKQRQEDFAGYSNIKVFIQKEKRDNLSGFEIARKITTMENRKDDEGKIEKEEGNNSSVSFSALRKDIFNVLYFMERLKNEEDQVAVDVANRIEKLKFLLAFICTYVQLSYSDFEEFEDIMNGKRQEVEILLRPILDDFDNNFGRKYNMHHVLPSLMDNIDDCINSCTTMTAEHLDFLLLNLHHLSKYHAEQIFPLMIQYDILQNVCGNIRDFHVLIVNDCIGHEIVEYVLPQFQLMAEKVGLFLWNDQTDGDSRLLKLDENDHNDGDSRLFKLAHLLLKIIPIELEVVHICFTYLKASTSAEVRHFIEQLLETSPGILRENLILLQQHMINIIAPSTLGARNIHVMIEFLLIILTDVPNDFIHHDKLFDLLACVGELTMEVSTIVHDLEEKSRNEESPDETSCATLNLLENIELLKKDLKHVYLKAPDSSQCCFPMSDGLLFMHLLHRHLNDLLDSNAYSISLIKEDIELVKEDLEFISLFFVNVEQELYKDLWTRVLDVAYEAKDVIDSIIVRDNGLLHLIFSLPLTLKKIKLIKEEVSDLHKIPRNSGLTVVNSPNKLVESKSLASGKIIVGFEEETNWIIYKLVRGPRDLDVISITGMRGSGKTTLAYKVYNDKLVSSYFDLRAWCTIDQDNDMEELWEKIFNQVTGSYSKFSANFDIADSLRKQLFGRRYLIVLDGLWDTATLDELTRPFPQFKEGSRIILTTRQKEVAFHWKRHCDPLLLRLLRPEESWELLEKRVFGKESCPDELLDVGKEIAQNCKGLPLVADLIAGVLTGLEKKKTVWLEVRNDLNSFVLNSEVEVMKVIELSYDHLPDHLKPCFLHLASYQKSTEIRVDWLKMSWCAEGLVERTETKSVEEMTDVYLDNLISSSLVITFNEIGDYPTCQIYDLVHDFCLTKARDEKLFDWISSSAQPLSFSDLMPRQMTIYYAKEHFGLRLHSIHNFVLFGSENKRHSGKHLYSLKITGDKHSDICHLRHLRLLRVLVLDSFFIMVKDSLLKEICMLNHLRFLQIGTEIKSLPSSFSNLWNLEILSVENEGSTLVLLPRIWSLVKLRVLIMNACSFFDMDTVEPIQIAEDSKLENLRLLRNLMLSYSKDTEDIFKSLPNLQNLSFHLKESGDCSTDRYWFPKLDFLTKLEVLTVGFESSNTNDSGPSVATNWSWNFHFPSNLKILLLQDFPLTSDSLSTISRMPNLEELTLVRTIIQGGEWKMGEDDTFKNLKCLKLFDVALANWEVGEESFAMLQELELWGCHELEEISPSFGDIYSLKLIKLGESPQLEDSARQIKQYVEDLTGEDKLQILRQNNIPLFK